MGVCRVNVTIDPGLGATGIAVWDAETWKHLERPVETRLWRIGHKWQRSKPWWERAQIQGRRLKALLYPDGTEVEKVYGEVEKVYCELPMFFEGESGHAVASEGSLVKLTYLVGVFAGIAGSSFIPVSVADWKGQMPKDVANRIIRRILNVGPKEYVRDEWDAVGIGLYAKGFFEGN